MGRVNMAQRRSTAAINTEDPFAAGLGELPPDLVGGEQKARRRASKAQGTPPWVYQAMGIMGGILMIFLLWYVHSSRTKAELARHEQEAMEHFSNIHDLHNMDEEKHHEIVAKYGRSSR